MNRALDLATQHVLATQRRNGSWLAAPAARITETALCTLTLARSPHPGAHRAAERGRVWLAGGAAPQGHHPVAHAVEAALLSLALETGDHIDVSHPSFTDRALSARARLLQAIALHAGRATRGGTGPAALRALLASELAAPGRLKRWTRVELWSAHALVETHFGNQSAARHATRVIADEQSPAGDFFANPVTTALAALALQAAAPGTAAARSAAQHLITSQLPDGTWRFPTSDVWDTALTVRAFHGAPVFGRRGLPAAVAFLVAAQNPDGGWPYRSGVESDNDTTAAVLIALGGPRGVPGTTIGAGLRHLAGQQTSDGLWRTWQSAGDPPVDDVIAHVVTALDRHSGRHRVRPAAARRWLTERLGTQGRWHAGWYRGLPYATAEVLPALDAAAAPVAGHPAARTLAETRNPDGGWPVEPGGPSVPAATGLALAALERGGLHDANHWAEGLTYLVETQRADGTWPGVPLMYGPRPLLTHYPTHTQAFAAGGLFAGQRRLGAARVLKEG
ncbi:prenyltransferase/squalene oxidase repeat-containing protein [Streptomyces roseifaciens]|uniref:prenyltransferase/squalene oxidase repeat-containing protein n=1 Tax=Streptomyces roseifaciens TaxID=1488406 RepID=UPI000717F26B|nr:prenyltransferase/squalene oxidase repeat-containing protein [Streptomyces roseifaciens]